MSKITNRRFYKPGTNGAKGSKLSLKTHPFVNGVIFDTEDPITSFHTYLSMIHLMVRNYESLINIPGINTIIPQEGQIGPEDIGKIKLFLSYLTESPVEITVKQMLVDNDLLRTVEALYE
jgi:hypothetical protein